jgi:sigma-B regulation protein RsbQ
MHPLQSLNARRLPASEIVASEPLVFAHGYGCDQTIWTDVTDRLPDFERWLFDWPGAGRAEPEAYDPSRHAHLEGYADDLLALVRSISQKAVTVVAHSVAASIAMLGAVREPALFRRLILVTPSPCFLRELPHYDGGFDLATLLELLDQLDQGVQAWSMAMSPVIMGQPDRPDLEQRLARSFCRQDPTIAARWARATFLSDVRTAVPRLTMPVELLQTREDALVPPDVGAWMLRQLPRGRRWPLQTTGHCPHVAAPHDVAEAIRLCVGGNA